MSPCWIQSPSSWSFPPTTKPCFEPSRGLRVRFNTAGPKACKPSSADWCTRRHFRPYFRSSFIRKWYDIAARELMTVPGTPEDPMWFANVLVPPITAAQATRALGRIIHERQGPPRVVHATATQVSKKYAHQVAALHLSNIELVERGLEGPFADETTLQTRIIAMSEEGLRWATATMDRAVQTVIGITSNDQGPRSRLYYVGMHRVPLSVALPQSTESS